MIEFCGQERCTIDGNGRLKLSPRFLADFRRHGDEVALHCLPEGALGIYPLGTWLQMRQTGANPAARAAHSIVFRRELRRMAAMTQTDSLSNQGRLTVPVPFRPLLGLEPGTDAMMVGCEIGIELWTVQAWEQEFERLRNHEQQKAEAEMLADLGGVHRTDVTAS